MSRPARRREELRRAAALVFVADPEDPCLDAGASHHLLHVLRLRPGEEVAACDGGGRWRICRLAGGGDPTGDGAPPRHGARRAGAGGNGVARLEPVGAIERDEPPAPRLHVGFALTKGDRPEWTVQKLTELGIDDVHPFLSARSVVRLDGAAAAARVERLRRVALEAAAQSRRTHLPTVHELAPFAEVLASMAAGGSTVAIAEPGAGPLPAACTKVLVGPEGGFSDGERENGATLAGLATLVLRAETAAVAAGCLLAARRDGFVPETAGR